MAKRKRKPYEGLTILQQRFCEILFSMEAPNHCKAIELAGYKQRGSTASVYANRLLKKANVRAYLNHLRDQSSQKAIITKAEVLKEIKKYAFANVQDYIGVGNKAKDFSKISRDMAAAIESIKIKENQTISKKGNKYKTVTTEFKLYSKDAGLDKLMKHLGLYEKDNRQKQDQMQIALIDMIAFVGGIE